MATELQLHQLTALLRRRKRLVLSLTLAGTLLGCAGTLLLPDRYTAKAQIVFEPHYATPAGTTAAPISQAAEDALIATQVTTLLSWGHLDRVRTGLANDPAFAAAAAAAAARASATDTAVREAIRSAWSTVAGWFVGDTGGLSPAPLAEPGSGRAFEPAIPDPEQFQRRLRAFQEAGSHVIAVLYTDRSPEVAALVANRTIDSFIESENEQKRAAITRELAWLGERVPALRAELERIEGAIQRYEAANGLADINPGVAMEQYGADLVRQLHNAEADLAARQARLAYVNQLRAGKADSGMLGEYLQSATLTDLYRQLTLQQQSESEVAAQVGPQHPRLRQIHGTLAELRGKIASETDRAVRNLQTDAEVAAAAVATLRTRVASPHLSGSDGRLRDLKNDAAVKRELYGTLVQRQEQLSGQQNITRADVRLLSLASVPNRPSSPPAWLFVLPGAIVCLISSCMLAVLADRLDLRLRSARDIREALGLPCLAAVPLLQRVGHSRPHERLMAKPFGGYTEAIRSLVASLGLASSQDPPKTVLVTSSLPGEGKTTLAVSLATYMASLGRRVLLVDLDFRHSSAQRELGRETGAGVLDLLLHERPASEVIQHLADLQLDYLPVSRRPADPFALFASNQMRQLLGVLRDRYDCVIVDGPPLLIITEARLLASMVDKVVMAVKWGSTRRDTAQTALELLGGADMPTQLHVALASGTASTRAAARDRIDVAGAVLTQVDTRRQGLGHYGESASAMRHYRQAYLGSE